MRGATSIDFIQKDIDKAYTPKRLRNQSLVPLEQITFIGDAIFPSGSDYPTLELGLKTIAGIVACLSK